MRDTFNAYVEDNKIAKAHIDSYERSRCTRLWDVYAKPSRYKAIAFDECRELMYALHGLDLRILSYNAQTFSVGFLFPDKDTGALRFCYCTRDYTRYCEY